MSLRPMSKSSNSTKYVVTQIPPYIYIYNDGSIERPISEPRIPPSVEDPTTGVSSKDIIFSNNPLLPARLFLPKLTSPSKIPVLVYFHGGAFCFESAFATHHTKYCNAIASLANVLIVSIEHRKAPEHFLPTAYDDCWAGLSWVASHAIPTPNPNNKTDQWLITHADFTKVFIGGDSSGGNIVHNVAMRAGIESLPCGVKLYGAYLNHPYFWGSKPIGSEPVIGFEETPQSMVWNFAYPNAPGGLDNPMINPLASGAPSLDRLGCSKMLVTVAGKDHLLFRDRTVLYYKAVKESGWKGELELFEEEEEDHVYHMYRMESEQGKKLMAKLANFLSQ